MGEDILHVYLAEICNELNIQTVYPKTRANEILSCKSDKVKKEKYSVWKLLELAVNKSFGYKMNELKFEKLKSGKWVCDKFYFSLSHSKGAVAVAVSSLPVGVDIETFKEPKNWGVANKILSEVELLNLNELYGNEKIDYFILKWTEKESFFKMQDEKSSFYNSAKDYTLNTKSKKIKVNNAQYYVSVACENLDDLQYFEINLNDIQ